MKYTISVIIALLVLMASVAYKNATPPDPDTFAKGWIEMVKKKNSEQYLAAYSLNAADVKWLLATINNDPHSDDSFKKEWEYRLSDTTLIVEVNVEVALSYGSIMRWADDEGIDLNALEFVRFYYDMKYQRRGPFFILDDVVLFIKHKDDYYSISMDEIVYANGKWIMGSIKNISISNQYLKESYELDAYMLDTTMVYSIDTTSAAPDEYAYARDSTAMYPDLTSKKAIKLQTKIGKYYQKIQELEEELYSGE